MTEESRETDSPDNEHLSPEDQRTVVRQRYGTIAASGSRDSEHAAETETDDSTGCCGGSGSGSTRTGSSTAGGSSTEDRETDSTSCCGDDGSASRAERLGYSPADLESAPEDANLGLGCGNPKALADLEPGETVVDLGSGGGFDCFLAAEALGNEGQVIGVDMTPEMVERARRTAERKGIENVEFRLGEIEALPVPDEHVDVVISNCVINLSPRKDRVFDESYRVLEPGGRLAISDIAVTPDGRAAVDRSDPDQLASCISGAATLEELRELALEAGFEAVTARETRQSDEVIGDMVAEPDLREALLAATVEGRKPV